MNFSRLGLAATALICASAPAAAQLKNGSFEKPKLASGTEQIVNAGDKIGPWTVVGTGNVALIGPDFSIGDLSLQAKKGLQFVNLGGSQNTKSGIEQTFKTVPGTQYLLWFRIGTALSHDAGFGPDSTVDVKVDGESRGSITVFGHAMGQDQTRVTWRKVGIGFTAVNATTTVDFLDGDGPFDGFCGVDGFSLTIQNGP